jgi:hypothetical protein
MFKRFCPEPEKTSEATCVTFKPTIWHRLGFGETSAPIIEDEDYPHLAPGGMTTEVRICFDWKDRLRLLLTGWVMVAIRHKTVLPVEGQVVSTSSVSVMRPNWEKGRIEARS